MTDKIGLEAVSRRRAFSLVGLSIAVGLATPFIFATSNAEAETVGMDRRQDRRTGRQERRDDRRTGRQTRRTERRN